MNSLLVNELLQCETNFASQACTLKRVLFHRFIKYIYVSVLFSPVKPEFGVIPSGQENHSKAEQLNFPGRELNVTNFVFLVYIRNTKQDGNKFIILK